MADDIKLPDIMLMVRALEHTQKPARPIALEMIERGIEAYARAAVEADRATRSPAANFALARKMGAAHLSDPEMRDTLADLKRRIKTEPGFKRALLQSAGIVDDDGNLTPLYRGGDAEAAHGIHSPKGGSDA